MRTALLLDDSPLVLSRFQNVAGWRVVGPDETQNGIDALLVDPAWNGYRGLGVLYSVSRRLNGEKGPVFALLRETSRPIETLLRAFGVPGERKNAFDPELILRQAAELGPIESDVLTDPVAESMTFEERVLVHRLMVRFTTVATLQEARRVSKDFLDRTFGAATGLQDERVRRLHQRAKDLCDLVVRVHQDLESARNEAEHIEQVFSRFLPVEVIDDLMRRKGDEALLRGEKRVVVALFSHVRDFGFYLENNEPSVLVEFLNRHFQLYSDIVRRHGGSINKYIGDAVFALFGAPVSHLDNTRRALNAAKEIALKLPTLEHPGVVFPPGGYKVGIGLNEGLAIVGNIGSKDSFDYTAIGDAINLAARLESLNKHYGTTILLSDALASRLDLDGSTEVLRTVDRAKVKGKKTATRFFTIVERPATEEDRVFLDVYEKALKMVKIANWMTARELLDEALNLHPGDELCRIHRERVVRYEANPPKNWDGAEELGFK